MFVINFETLARVQTRAPAGKGGECVDYITADDIHSLFWFKKIAEGFLHIHLNMGRQV